MRRSDKYRMKHEIEMLVFYVCSMAVLVFYAMDMRRNSEEKQMKKNPRYDHRYEKFRCFCFSPPSENRYERTRDSERYPQPE